MKVGQKAKGFWFESNITDKIGFIKEMRRYHYVKYSILESNRLR